VLCDRFNDSTIAYQGVARGFSVERVAAECDFACGGLAPDLTFYLDVSPDIGFARTIKSRPGHDRIESEALCFHEKIRSAFLELAKSHSKRMIVLDASGSVESVLHRAQERLNAFFLAHRQ
jgi:dTMP kinase